MANLLLSSGFEGNLSLTAPYNVSGGNAYQDISGTDSSTGYSWPGDIWGGKSTIQLLTMGGDMSSVISNSIDTVSGVDGASTQALHLDVNQKISDASQSPFMISPQQSPSEFYISEWIKLPSNLGELLGPGGWMTGVPEWKSAGDFRVVTNIQVDNNGTPYWAMKWDTNANGNVPMQTFWEGQNHSVPVPQGEWAHVEFYTNRDNTNGQVWLKVNGQTVFDHVGDTIGQNNAPIDRIFLASPYSNTPADMLVDNVQVWDGLPSSTSSSPPPAATTPTAPSGTDASSDSSPAGTTIGSGSDSLVLKISQDAYNGSAQYTVSVDGQQVGGTLTASASHAAGQYDTITVQGDWDAGAHTVAVNFLNDAYGGTAATDRNLHVDGATYNGTEVSGASLSLTSNGPASFQINDTAASSGNSAAVGTSAAHAVNGTAGDDALAGTSGADLITGAQGNDKLTGADGHDVFAFSKGDGFDWISDFTRGSDTLKMEGMSQSDISWHETTWNGVGSGLEVVYNNGQNGGVFLPNVHALDWNDFSFG
ncbi:MAG TPA: carbohydrate-binding domain-containing protein [Roseomonas sp.]|nr:carbohydrate-binding domain-containing protein [Roseomonas sp.]